MILILVLLVRPSGLFGLGIYPQHVLIVSLFYVMMASSWNLLAGYTGQVSFGHAAKDISVKENMERGAFPKSARGRLKETLERVMELFPILCQRKDQPAGTLSGGEQQMLAIGPQAPAGGRTLAGAGSP